MRLQNRRNRLENTHHEGVSTGTGRRMLKLQTRTLQGFFLLLIFAFANCSEMTFELADNDKQCFFEELDSGVKFDIDFQVISGGNYDVDCFVTDPMNNVLYQEKRKQYDSFSHITTSKGAYKVCFSNEFSTFSHKVVYLDFRSGEERRLFPDMNRAAVPLTQMESTCLSIHEILKVITDSQTWYRLREAHDRIRAEHLNSRVSYWSIGETIFLLLVGIGQVVMVRSFFAERKTQVNATT